MQDWRLDSGSGGNGLPLNATVCAVGRQWAADRAMRAGGGAAAHTYIVLDRVCEKHVLVVGGRTYERGFTVNPDGMSLTLSKAIPWVGRVFVLGFGRVVREKKPNDWTRVRPVAEHFPVPGAINAGHHPYEWMPASSKHADPTTGTAANSAMFPYTRNHAAQARINRPRLYDPALTNVAGRDRWQLSALLNAWGRATPYEAYGFAANGACLRLDVSAGVMHETGAVLPREKALVFGAGSQALPAAAGQARNLYFNNLMPDEDGNLYALPRRHGCPVLKIPAPGYDDVVNLGPGAADPAAAYVDPFDANNKLAVGSAAAGYSSFIRLFDGRMLGFPMYLTTGTANPNDTLLLFDPVAATSESIPLPARAGGYGISRWMLPAQAADGRVYCRPSVAPGNLTLIFDPATKQIELDDFGYVPQRMDIKYTAGVPCANGKIYYCQTMGAATDINQFLVLDTATRTSEVIDLGFVHSTVLPFLSSMALSDGCPVFMGPLQIYGSLNTTLTSVDKGYNRLIYDPQRDDFTLYRSAPPATNGDSDTSSVWRTWWFRSAYADGDQLAVADISRDSAEWLWRHGRRFLLPEFALMTMDMDLQGYSLPLHPAYTCHYLETPPQTFPGTYCRQAFFGTC